jgi:glutamate/aspartate transport system substrate-binding protein
MKARVLLVPLLLATTPVLAQGDTLGKIRNSGTITLGYRADAVPFSFEGADNRPSGFSIDICRRRRSTGSR